MKTHTDKDFEDSLEYWRDLAKMLLKEKQALPDLPSEDELLLAATKAYSAPYACPPEKEYQKYCKHDVICAFKAGARWMRERVTNDR